VEWAVWEAWADFNPTINYHAADFNPTIAFKPKEKAPVTGLFCIKILGYFYLEPVHNLYSIVKPNKFG
jgi:hypothetical protein